MLQLKKIPFLKRHLDNDLLLGLDEAARVLSKVNDMRTQRTMLVERLRSALQADDVTTELLAVVEDSRVESKSDKTDALFAKHLCAHDKAASLVRLNLAAQEKICKALIEIHARVALQKHAILEQRQRYKFN